jgi:UDP-2-acetamido-3-amino-2,3-dideoxy-glucuronate N-acetyltransferase
MRSPDGRSGRPLPATPGRPLAARIIPTVEFAVPSGPATTEIDLTAEVDPRATVGTGSRVWQYAHIREHVVIGRDCVIGRGAYIGAGVRIGHCCKIQNHALIYEPAVLGDGVFIGPAVIFTNDHYPRAIGPDGRPKGADDWSPVGVTVLHGASIGAHAVCVAPVTIGRWAVVGAGAVVTADVPDFGLAVGIPARRVGWIGPAGRPLVLIAESTWSCPVTQTRYHEYDGALTEAAA